MFGWAPLPCPTCTLHHSTCVSYACLNALTAHGEVRFGFARRLQCKLRFWAASDLGTVPSHRPRGRC
eukprot:2824686-Prymnesium_polylepis.1